MNSVDYMVAALKTFSIKTTKVKPELSYGIIGAASETGELLDLLKKLEYHDKIVSREAIADEVGDCLWYLALILHAIGGTFEEAYERNIAKLNLRHVVNKGIKDKEAEAKVQAHVAGNISLEQIATAGGVLSNLG